MKKCLYCKTDIKGRTDKIFCNPYCKSSYHNEKTKEKEDSIYIKVDKQLKTNRRILNNTTNQDYQL